MGVIRWILYIVVLIGVLALAYYATKWIAGVPTLSQTSRNIRILEKVMIGKDSYLLIVKVQDKVMMLSATPGGITKLEDLEEYIEAPKNSTQDFGKVFLKQKKKRNRRDKS